jgi:hypothetical protein
MRPTAGKGLLAAALAALALGAAGAGIARADIFEPIALGSAGLLEHGRVVEQANVAEHPALSGDGRYVAFDGSFGGVRGVWRRDLASGAIEQVAGGDAELPSISGDGRYISFTSNEGAALAAITNGQIDSPQRAAPDVYVRDMSKTPGAQGAFVVASAPSGSEQALTYKLGPEQPEQSYGSVASGRSAMSADGRYVAFVTTAVSNLVTPETPALQVAVRDMWTDQTTLASVEYEGGVTNRPVATTVEGGTTVGAAYGAVAFPATGAAALSQGASISADGSTVAWLGQELARQVAVLGGAEAKPEYAEPLWRRIAAGPQEPTRRVTGGADPAAPACAASAETQLAAPPTSADPCQGPFVASLRERGPGVYAAPSVADFLPRLSADGLTVAFLASQRPIASGEEFVLAEQSDDLYVVDMAAGLTRVQALRRLTELASANANVGGGAAALADMGVSPDGTEVAFATRRTAFPLGSPAYVSPPAPKAEMEELYDVDLADDTLTRVTHGYQGETVASEAAGVLRAQIEAGSPSFSTDGNTLAFSSAATNLVYGEDNRANSVFVVTRERFQSEAVAQYVSPPPEGPRVQPAWLLSAFARSLRDGHVLLEVQAPGAGDLSAGAIAAVRTGPRRARTPRRHGAGRAGRHRSAATVARRRVSVAARAVAGEGLVTLTLALSRGYRGLASQRGGLSTSITITFAAAGHPSLRVQLAATFLRRTHRAHRSRRTSMTRRGRR